MSTGTPRRFAANWLNVHIFRALLLAAAFSLSSCEDDDPVARETTLDLAVQGRFGTEPLELESRTYAAPTAAEGFRLSRLSFFVSELQLLQDGNANASVVDVSDVEYIELGPNGSTSLTLEDVPVGMYSRLRMRLGLTAAQDSLRPQDFPAGSPLARSEEYWVDWGSYVFLKLEGKTDTLQNNVQRYDQPFIYHIGRAAQNSRVVDFPMNIVVGPEGNATIELDLDVRELLGIGTDTPLPLNGVIDHRNNYAQQLMDHAVNALSVKR